MLSFVAMLIALVSSQMEALQDDQHIALMSIYDSLGAMTTMQP
jgi:hypothetical protein